MNILLTSIGRRSYMVNYFKDALKGIGEVHAANSEFTYSLSLADKSTITPLIYDDCYIRYLVDYSRENNIFAILPLFDIDLSVLSKNKHLFDEIGTHIIVSGYDTTQLCNDKWETYKFLLSNGIKTPKTYIDLNESRNSILNNELSLPVIIKPRWGMASIGIYRADTMEELDILYRKAKMDIENSYLKYESATDEIYNVIIQQKMDGGEYGIDVLNDLDGFFLTAICKRKIAMRAGETDSAEIIDDVELYRIGEYISNSLRHVGNLDVDCFKANGEFYIMELNNRFGGQYPFVHLAGANFPKAVICMLQNKPIDNDLITVNIGTIGVKDLNPVRLK